MFLNVLDGPSKEDILATFAHHGEYCEPPRLSFQVGQEAHTRTCYLTDVSLLGIRKEDGSGNNWLLEGSGVLSFSPSVHDLFQVRFEQLFYRHPEKTGNVTVELTGKNAFPNNAFWKLEQTEQENNNPPPAWLHEPTTQTVKRPKPPAKKRATARPHPSVPNSNK